MTPVVAAMEILQHSFRLLLPFCEESQLGAPSQYYLIDNVLQAWHLRGEGIQELVIPTTSVNVLVLHVVSDDVREISECEIRAHVRLTLVYIGIGAADAAC